MTQSLKVALVCEGAAARNAFKMFNDEFPATFSVLDANVHNIDEHRYWFKPGTIDVVLCGMTSSVVKAAGEIKACEMARDASIPYGFFSDLWGVHKRPWFEDLREGASFIFVIHESEVESAKKLFPNAEVVVTGSPVLEKFFEPPENERDVARKSLGAEGLDRLLFFSGGKLMGVNTEVLMHLAHVYSSLFDDQTPNHGWRVIFTCHPDEVSACGGSYQRCIDEINQFSGDRFTVDFVTNMPASHIIPAADVVLSCITTSDVEAICRRIPAISILNSVTMKRAAENVGGSWRPAHIGASYPVTGSVADLETALRSIFYSNDQRHRLNKVVELVTKPEEQGQAVRLMYQTLEQVVAATMSC